MALRRFAARIRIARRPEEVFAWVADHRNVPRALDGLESWAPLGPRTTGRGARFAVSVHALGLSLDNVLVLDTWAAPRAIGWRSESGTVFHAGCWRFEPRPGATEVELSIGYEPPGGIVGRLVAGRVDGVVRHRMERALARMRDLIEGPEGAPAAPGGS
jgi:uncharacterized membrane protein